MDILKVNITDVVAGERADGTEFYRVVLSQYSDVDNRFRSASLFPPTKSLESTQQAFPIGSILPGRIQHVPNTTGRMGGNGEPLPYLSVWSPGGQADVVAVSDKDITGGK